MVHGSYKVSIIKIVGPYRDHSLVGIRIVSTGSLSETEADSMSLETASEDLIGNYQFIVLMWFESRGFSVTTGVGIPMFSRYTVSYRYYIVLGFFFKF